MRTTLKFLALAGLLMAPSLAAAQSPARRATPRTPMAGDAMARATLGGGVTEMLNARRQLNLTPRQVAQLDSIERTLWADRERVSARMRMMGDSLRSRGRVGERPMADSATRDSLRAAMRARMEAQRPQMEEMRRRDSTARVAADRVLTDAQREQWRVMQAERRGFVRGMQAGNRVREERRAPRRVMERRRPQ
jgi:hypothetical protein